MKDPKPPRGRRSRRGASPAKLMRPPVSLSPAMSRLMLCICLLPLALAACVGLPSVERGDGSTLSGTVFYLQQIALPPDAVVHVRLDDVSRADVPAVTLARQTIPTAGRHVPIPFTLDYDPRRVDAGHRYVIRARIRDGDGSLLWTTDSPTAVLTQGAPVDDVEVRVVQAADTGYPLVGPTWRLIRIDTSDGALMRPDAEEIDTLVFGADERLGGQADCNHYFASYTVEGDGDLAVRHVGGTLAACLEPSLGDTLVRRIGEVESFEIAGTRLRLTTGDGTVLVFERHSGTIGSGPMIPQEVGRTFVFDCADPVGGGFSFTARTGPGEVALWLPERFGGRYLVLGQTRAASGARYEGDGVVFWNKGDEALLEVEGERFAGCTFNSRRSVWEHARLSGIDFRAIGQEPGWLLDIREGERIRFLYDYGEKEITMPTPEPTVDPQAGRTVYRAATEAHDLAVTITGEPCTDVMSGESFEASVAVNLDGETYRGCGRALH